MVKIITNLTNNSKISSSKRVLEVIIMCFLWLQNWKNIVGRQRNGQGLVICVYLKSSLQSKL